MLILGGLGLAAGIGSSAASAVEAGNAKRETRKKEGLINQQAAEDTAWFNKQYYTPAIQRADIQDMLRTLQENQQRNDARSDAQAAITGATPEQRQAARETNRKAYADSVAQLAANAAQLKDQYLANYQNQRNRYYAQRLGMQDELANISRNTSNQWANAAGNAFMTGASLMANGLGGLETTPNWTPIESLKPQAGAGTTYITPPKPAVASDVLSGLRGKLGF